MRRRKLWIALAVVLVAAAVAAVVYLRSRSAPEAARLLPESDAVLFINLRLMRLAHVFGELPPISYDPDYEQFVKETGFQFERDLDQAAFAMHVPAGGGIAGGQNLSDAARYSEVFVGKFDARRADAYLRKLSSGSERYRDVVIYVIPHEGRTVRVAILGLDIVAVSNLPDVAAIHQMIDKYRAAAWPASAPSLVGADFHHVPLATVAWALTRIPAQGARAPVLALPGLDIPVPALAGSTIVASASYRGALHLRVEALTQSETDARQLQETANTFLVLLKGVESSTTQGGTDADVKAFFNSLKVEEHGTRVALTATLPQGFIRKALTPPPNPPLEQTPPPPSQKEKGKPQ